MPLQSEPRVLERELHAVAQFELRDPCLDVADVPAEPDLRGIEQPDDPVPARSLAGSCQKQ